MSMGREIRRRCKACIAPIAFAALTAYFGWSASHGDRGLQAYALRQDQLRDAQGEQARAQAEFEMWERKVAALRSNRLDPDALDQQARASLNLADPSEVVVMYGAGKKLF